MVTEEGKELLKSVQIIMHQVEKLEEETQQERKKEDDVIRIVTTTGVTNLWLVRKLKIFLERYPQYLIRIITSDEKVDVLTHYADIAILPKVDPSPNIVQKRLFTFHIKLFASKEYLDKYGVPKTTADLDHHRLISFYHNAVGHRGDVDWHLRAGTQNNQFRTPFIVVNSAIGQYEAAKQGLGIIAISEEFPYIGTALIGVLPNEKVDVPIYFAANVQKLSLAKVVALEKFLTTEDVI